MPVTDVAKDTDALTLAVTAEFDAAPDQAWQLWSDPRKLERWWGPPTYPATVVDHDLAPGGRATYFMTGPEGDKYGGYWDIVEVEPGAFSVIHEGRSFSVVSGGGHFLIDGVRVPVPPDPRDWTGSESEIGAGGPQKITAPMPGRLGSILVNIGDEVEAGAGVAVVEAMKMQNEMKARQAGKVVAIHAKEGATVAAGDVLVTIE